MQKILFGTTVSLWYDLVRDASENSGRSLGEALESYLIFVLVRTTRESGLISRIVALAFLDSLNYVGRIRSDKLRDVGDQCLIVAGLFPGVAKRRLVRTDYFVDIGRSAFGELALLRDGSESRLYREVSVGFPLLVSVLNTVRSDVFGKIFSPYSQNCSEEIIISRGRDVAV